MTLDLSSDKLLNETDATHYLAKHVMPHQDYELVVADENCFQENSKLSLGKIRLNIFETDEPLEHSEFETAILHGQYTWSLPDLYSLNSNLQYCLIASDDYDLHFADQLLKETFQDIVRRLLLLLPAFDAGLFSELPLRTPTTLVVDTSAVKQGALDFACRFLYPMARIKIPAVVPVEILNMVDRFFNQRRKKKTKSKQFLSCLSDHIKSQGAQRALLRLEWHSQIEVERQLAGLDPLRAIFKRDSEITEDNLSVVQRSLADRLIFETAIGHISQANPDHKICIVTSDQGMARMALAEGMTPLYFDARNLTNPLGKTLTGTLFNPFDASFYRIPLTALLWEVATCFGSASIISENGEFKVTAIGESLSWYPYQSREDLLWCKWIPNSKSIQSISVLNNENDAYAESNVTATSESSDDRVTDAEISEELEDSELVPHSASRIKTNTISAQTFINLIDALSTVRSIETDQLKNLIGISTSSIREYSNFLRGSGFADKAGDIILVQPTLSTLNTAIAEIDFTNFAELMLQIPSFNAYIDLLRQHQLEPEWSPVRYLRRSTAPAYQMLAEVSTLAIHIPDVGFVVTDAIPEQKEFVDAAVSTYDFLSEGDQWGVLTGLWLENLASSYKYHPSVVRNLLETAAANGVINRYFEGSTIEKRFENHKISVLESNEDGGPSIREYHLYRGDFLFSRRASVRIQIERVANESA